MIKGSDKIAKEVLVTASIIVESLVAGTASITMTNKFHA
jgi:hypothetical protein